MATDKSSEIDKCDHRAIGMEQDLFFFDELSPGCSFWLPKGTIIYNKLMDLLKKEYRKRGFQEVITPIMFKKELWQTSGHWDKYKDNMFLIENDKEIHSLKAMNCPSHCLMFKHRIRSYKDLPIRFADFGVLHRNEASGALTGLSRVRKFQQDDAHCFCRQDQIKSEMLNCFGFLEDIYGKIFNFEFDVALSTRPDAFIGDEKVWDRAEAELVDALQTWRGKNWTVKQKDGAFYGPKIDIHLKDSAGKKHQCATIQLDFNLPERFQLEYKDEKQSVQRPVIIHRAIFGSFERFISILCEHYGGKWPFWLSPRQVKLVPVHDKFLYYAEEVAGKLKDAGFNVDIDDSDNTLNKKVRNAQTEQYNYILVVGQKEIDTKTVNVRYRDNDSKKEITIDDLLKEFNDLQIKYK
jgi:threonyl-tRNA synthetase